MFNLTLETAKYLIAVAEQKARQLGLSNDIAVVDEGANLIAFHRMDGAKIAGIEISQNKAWTSVAMQMPTANLAQAAQPGFPSFGINTTNQGKLVILGGGVPLVVDKKVIGGIGVSGGTSAQDIEVANAAALAFSNWLAGGETPIVSGRSGFFHY
ncbi:GlcG/HbpS family heme-binding protein [Paenibacillus glycanilyticus]|uniref:GlcG/HbpS family heme-binding protein n=1 Tax=Paenibacillus glycanilyticus TaxID=126569 RepID=UPI003EBE15F6